MRPVLIAGPTASGKSALALALAERDGGLVINADAAQVYACWRVLTARPGPEDLARAPHELYGHVSCAVRFSVGAWLGDAAAAIAEAQARGLRPIVVGGTGLYLTNLTEGLAAIPAIPADLRRSAEALPLAALLETLARDDPETFARIDRRNPVRVQRAWEVLAATGRGLADWHRATPPPVLDPDRCLRYVLDPDISALNATIGTRFRAMLEAGALDECRAFLRAGHDPGTPAGRVLGAPPLFAHLAGTLTLDAAIALSVTATRRFAKRQRTWLRSRMPGWTRIPPDALAAIPPD